MQSWARPEPGIIDGKFILTSSAFANYLPGPRGPVRCCIPGQDQIKKLLDKNITRNSISVKKTDFKLPCRNSVMAPAGAISEFPNWG